MFPKKPEEFDAQGLTGSKKLLTCPVSAYYMPDFGVSGSCVPPVRMIVVVFQNDLQNVAKESSVIKTTLAFRRRVAYNDTGIRG